MYVLDVQKHPFRGTSIQPNTPKYEISRQQIITNQQQTTSHFSSPSCHFSHNKNPDSAYDSAYDSVSALSLPTQLR